MRSILYVLLLLPLIAGTSIGDHLPSEKHTERYEIAYQDSTVTIYHPKGFEPPVLFPDSVRMRELFDQAELERLFGW